MKTIIIIQARMTSTRLPGKVLKEVMGKTLLAYQIERLRKVSLVEGIVIATTTNDSDQPIIDECKSLGIDIFRGDEHDVLARYYLAATQYAAAAVVRITSDCPLIDPEVVDSVIGRYLNAPERFDYVSNTQTRSYPRGLDTEVFSYQALEEAFCEAGLPAEREHVTPFIYNHPQRYKLGQVINPENCSDHRWTVDTPDDFLLISNILSELYPRKPGFIMNDVFDILKEHPHWADINKHVEQKKE